jgi:diguanylate cyclase (GGDEF)-like protein
LTTALAITLGIFVAGALLALLAGYRYFRGVVARRGSAAPGTANSAELEEELRQAQRELRRARQLAALADTLDLDELLARVLQGASVLMDADAAAVVLSPERATPVVKAMNLSSGEALTLVGSWRPEGQPQALTIRYRQPERSATNAIQTAVLVTLSAESDEPLGMLAVFWRRRVNDPAEEQIGLLEDLAVTAGKAIQNARKFGEFQEMAVRDPLSGLHNRRYFHEQLATEVKRAHRYDRRLSLIFFDLDDFKSINEEIGHLGGDAVLAEVAQRLRSVVRGADIACRVGGDEFAVILPESSLEDAERFFQRLQLAIRAQPIGRVTDLLISAGMAELGRDDDSTSFFRRVDEALYRAKRSGKGRVVAADGPEES